MWGPGAASLGQRWACGSGQPDHRPGHPALRESGHRGAGPWSVCPCQRSDTSPGQPQTGEQPAVGGDPDLRREGHCEGLRERLGWVSQGPASNSGLRARQSGVLRPPGQRIRSDEHPGSKQEGWVGTGPISMCSGPRLGLGVGMASHRAGLSLLLWASPLGPSAAGYWSLLKCPRCPQFNSWGLVAKALGRAAESKPRSLGAWPWGASRKSQFGAPEQPAPEWDPRPSPLPALLL